MAKTTGAAAGAFRREPARRLSADARPAIQRLHAKEIETLGRTPSNVLNERTETRTSRNTTMKFSALLAWRIRLRMTEITNARVTRWMSRSIVTARIITDVGSVGNTTRNVLNDRMDIRTSQSNNISFITHMAWRVCLRRSDLRNASSTRRATATAPRASAVSRQVARARRKTKPNIRWAQRLRRAGSSSILKATRWPRAPNSQNRQKERGSRSTKI
ncbi:unnamed protein product [Prorocentrum cordatum]|uniref:Uncharacterized protein n=1 Tax=Prorocentrum cordatum TaxID=2364126 RepID=A0ABN9SZ87_9DINO|nr:unnamed protein product [Polarella glacialis]